MMVKNGYEKIPLFTPKYLKIFTKSCWNYFVKTCLKNMIYDFFSIKQLYKLKKRGFEAVSGFKFESKTTRKRIVSYFYITKSQRVYYSLEK